MMKPQRQADRLARLEADLRSAYRRGDPGAELLADCVRRQRQALETAIERNGREQEDRRQMKLVLKALF